MYKKGSFIPDAILDVVDVVLEKALIEVFKTLVGVGFIGILAVVEALCVFVVDVDMVVFLVCVTLELRLEDTKVESVEV